MIAASIYNLESGTQFIQHTPTSVNDQVDIDVHEFDKAVLYEGYDNREGITTISDAAKIVSQHKRGMAGKLQVLVLDRQLMVNKYILIDQNISPTELIAKLALDIAKHGDNIILASNSPLENRLLKRIDRALTNMGSSLTDAIVIKQDYDITKAYQSWSSAGKRMTGVTALHESQQSLINNLSEQVPELKGINILSQSDSDIRFRNGEAPFLDVAAKHKIYKKAFGERAARVIRSKMPIAFDQIDQLTPGYQKTYP